MKNKTTLTLIAILMANVVIMAIIPSFADTQITTDTGDDFSPSIIQTNDGRMWVFWHSYRGGIAALFYKTYDGIFWSDDTPLTNDSSHTNGNPSAVQLDNGTVLVVWTSNRDGLANFNLFYKSTSDSGLHWSADTRLTTDLNDDKRPSVLQSSDGTIWVFWQSRRTGNDEIFYKTYKELLWSNDTQLTFNSNEDQYPSSIQTTDGSLWVFWDSNRTGNRDLFYKFSFDSGESWSEETQLTTDPSSDIFPSAVQITDGIIIVAWQSNRDGLQPDIYYKLFDGVSWSPENMATWGMEQDMYPAIFQAANGTIWFVWSSDKTPPPAPQNLDIFCKFVITDMVIKKIDLSSRVLNPGNLLNVTVWVLNEGSVGVTYQVTTYYNGIPIGIKTHSMIPNVFGHQLTTTLDTSALPYGYYTISAKVNTTLSDNDPADNTFIGDTLILAIPGDVNGDRTVDIQDASLISAHWYPGPPIGPLGYNVQYDINKDGKVGVGDIATVNGNWFKSW